MNYPAPPGDKDRNYKGDVDRTGRIWVGQVSNTRGFFGFWNGQRWEEPAFASTVAENYVWFGFDQDGEMTALNSGEGILKIKDNQIVSRVPLSMKLPVTWSAHFDSQRNIWGSSVNQGLYRILPDGQVRQYTATNGLTYDSLRFTFEDREKNLWVGTSGGGLMRLKPRTVVNFGPEQGLPERNVKAVVEEAPGRMLVGTYGKGVQRLEEGRFSPVLQPDGNPRSVFTQCLLRDREGNTWVGSYSAGGQGRGLLLIRGTDTRIIGRTESGGDSISAVFEDSKGRVWIGGNETISLYFGGRFQRQAQEDDTSLGEVRFFAEDPSDGTIWAASSRGLLRWDGEIWEEVKGATGATLRELNCLRIEPDGTVWIGQGGVGILRLRQGKWSSITTAKGLPSRDITCFLMDDFGHWWLGSKRGVIRVTQQELGRVADGTLSRLPYQIFNLSDGLQSVECTAGHQSIGLKDSQGRLWFATLKGLAMIDPAHLKLNTTPPPVLIEKVTYRDAQGLYRELPQRSEDRVSVPAGSREVGIHYAGLSFTAPEKMHFAYKVEGRDDDWVDASGPGRLSIYFHTPRPGPIRFQVKAANSDGVWNPIPASITVVPQPYFWQTIWFRLLAIGGTAGALGIGVWRTGRNKLQHRIERLEHEQILEHERARLGVVLEGTSDFVGFSDPKGHLLFLNPAGRRMIGIDDSVNIRTWKIPEIHPLWAARRVLDQGLPTALRDGVWSGETALLHKDGHEIPISQVVIAHKNPDGSLNFYSTIARDITERNRQDEALKQSEDRYRSVIEASIHGIFVHQDSIIQFVNSSLARMYGYENPSELIGRNVWETFISPEAEPELRSKVERTLRGERLSIFSGWQGVRKDGSRIWIESSVAAITWKGRPALLAFHVDISERKQAEVALRSSEERLRASIENTPYVAVQWYDEDGRVLFWNSASKTVFGWSADEAIGETLDQLIFTPQQTADFVKVLKEIKVTGDSKGPVELDFHRRDGSLGTLVSTVFRIPSPQGEPCFVCMDVDVTERKQAEAQIRELNADLEHRVAARTLQLQAANKELEAFSYSVSHDLRAPLRALNGFALALCEDHAGQLDADGLRYARRIQANAVLMDQLVEALLSLARVARAELRTTPVDLSCLAHTIADQLRTNDPKRDVEFVVAPDCLAIADQALVRVVLLNLLGNAWKYSGKKPRARIEFGSEQIDGETTFFVRDDGAGFDMTQARKLFGAFQRLHLAGEFEGHGIGLATVQRVVHRHGGRIWANAAVDQGATFYFTLGSGGVDS